MNAEINTKKEHWDYIFKVFPFVDLPFNILIIYLSNNWLITLAFVVLFPIVATSTIYLSQKKNFQPGYWIMGINGLLFIPFMYYSVQTHNLVKFDRNYNWVFLYV